MKTSRAFVACFVPTTLGYDFLSLEARELRLAVPLLSVRHKVN